MSPTAPTISASGISAPTYSQLLAYLQAQYQAIFGSDVYLGNDSQDGQLLGIFAQAIADANAATVAVYNAFSPSTAQGNGLSSVVKINGLTRLSGGYATATVTIAGTANSPITNGSITDQAGNLWTLPSTVTIPSSGTVNVTVVCQTLGAVGAPSSFTIATPTYGWQSVSYVASSYVAGSQVETDAALRVRQSASTTLPAQTIFEAILAAIAAVNGVTRSTGVENNTGSANPDGVPARSLAYVVEGGSALAIATAINNKIPPGTPTYGTSSQVVTDSNGVSRTINFSIATENTIVVDVTINPGNGWDTTAGELAITAALQSYFAALPIGQNVSYFGVAQAIINCGAPYQGTFTVGSLTIGISGGPQGTTDLTIAWNQVPSGSPTVNYTIS